MFRTGQQIGTYILIRRIGRGGFGEVWLAERRAKFVTTKVAVKLPHDEQVDTDVIKQEAALWEQANGHPNVLPIIDADEYDGQIVIVSEYAPDGSLDDVLKKENALPIRKAVELAVGISRGLEFLHSRKIIHRDIKPANVLLQGDTPRLADFGISRVIRTTSQSATLTGTPSYMAPEAFDRKRNVRTDVWSVGVILYQMLKGELPFPQENLTDLLGAIVRDEPEPLPDRVPPVLQRIVMKALTKDPSQRYQSAREMREDLADFLVRISQRDVQLTQAPVPTDSLLNARTLVNSTSLQTDEPNKSSTPPQIDEPNKRRSFWKPLLISCSVLLILLLLGIFIPPSRLGVNPQTAVPSPTPKTPRQIANEKTEQAMEMLYVNDYEKAKLLSKEAIDADSTYALAHAIYGDAFWDEDPTEEEDSSTNTKSQISKGEIFKVFDVSEPTTAEDLAARSWALLANKNWDRAKQDIEKVAIQKPDWAWALMQKAFVVIGRGGGGCVNEKDAKEILDAISTYKKINSLKPKYAMAYMNLAGAYICNKQNQEAFAAYEQAISLWQKPDFYVRRGNFYLDTLEQKTKQKNIENAQKDFEEAIKKEPKSSDAYVGLSKVYYYKEDYQNCINEADKALSIKPSYNAYIQRGMCRAPLAAKEKDEKGFDEALDNLEKAKEMVDKYNDPTIRQNSLAFYYSQKANIQINYKATYLLTEKFLKNRTSDNKKAVTTELINAKSSMDQAVLTNQDKKQTKDYEKFKGQIEKAIRDFKKKFG